LGSFGFVTSETRPLKNSDLSQIWSALFKGASKKRQSKS